MVVVVVLTVCCVSVWGSSSVASGRRSADRDGHSTHHQSQRAQRSVRQRQRVHGRRGAAASRPDDTQTHRQGTVTHSGSVFLKIHLCLSGVSSSETLEDFLRMCVIGVQEHECQLTRDIVDLIDREVDLMTRGVKAARLEGLRRRICTLFLQYIKTPAFNPEVAKLLKVSTESCCSQIRRLTLSGLN